MINNVQETFQNSDIKTHVKEISTDKAIGKCPICQKELIDKGKFYGCTGYKEGCKFSLPKKWSSKTLTKKNISDLLTKKETTIIKGFKNKKGTSFNAKLQLKDNKLEFIFDNKK
ncbi:topoisomerase C-terminal repeat-containing protein [Carnobacterium maltaromaticum]|uniref:topoisomerase C-terminal repeat-containing protein n=1 Tax=Carnobacterium maltaromaticum TaxID=2751 RepID=UPI0039BEC475